MLPQIVPSWFRRAQHALLVGACLTPLGCGQSAPSEAADQNSQAVINGQPSPAAEDSVFAIVDRMGSWCSAVAVAPNLALTARRCVATDQNDPRLKCDSDTRLGFPIEQVADPRAYTTIMGPRKELPRGAAAKRFFGGPTLDLCLNDVLLVEFEAPLLRADGSPLPLLPLRLDGPAKQAEPGTLIGWGYDVDDPEGSPLPALRRKASLSVLQVGPADYPYDGGGMFSIPANAFLTGQGGCNGDYGGPFVSADTGAVIGLMSDVEPFDLSVGVSRAATTGSTKADCVSAHTVFADLVSQQDWIRAAFAEVGQAPWLEGKQRPAEVGQSCHDDAECISGACTLTEQGGFCSARCENRACPADMECIASSGASWCVPSVAGGGVTSSGCTIGAPPRQLSVWRLLGYCALALMLIRRRRARAHTSSSRLGRLATFVAASARGFRPVLDRHPERQP